MTVSLTTSWDDGHPFDSRVAELLAKYGFQGTFYVPCRNSEGRRVMSADELRALGSAFEIGGHTLDHVRLHGLSADEARRQIRDGKQQLEDTLGGPVRGFCYPGGVHDASSRVLVRDAGFEYARTVDNFHAGPTADRFRVPTTIQLFPHSRWTYVKNFARRGAWRSRAPLVAEAMRARSLDELLVRLLDHVLGRGGVFHLWGHSWELDDNGLWPVLERFLAHASERVPPPRRLDNAAIYASSATQRASAAASASSNRAPV
jgi:peptidoglycan/xylan/chitin deacetylase (PgdA/CDA1 family)